jgi:hypothetical protein
LFICGFYYQQKKERNSSGKKAFIAKKLVFIENRY